MPNRGQQNKSRRVNLVIGARAGLLPASDDVANEIHIRTSQTADIVHTAKNHLGSVACVSDDLAITNILADLRHYCDTKRVAFKKLDKAARALYLEALIVADSGKL
jgi:hypothetical protein